ncbi:MAG: flagellar export chaperone FliS [Brevinema sp.]
MYGHEAYKNTDIETASRLKLVVMLYAGAIRFINIAIQAIKNNQNDIANQHAIKAQDIVSELLASLNFEAGDIADELSSLYIYVHKLLIEGNIKKDPALFQEAIDLLENLKDAWDNLLAQEEQNTPVQETKNINISG